MISKQLKTFKRSAVLVFSLFFVFLYYFLYFKSPTTTNSFKSIYIFALYCTNSDTLKINKQFYNFMIEWAVFRNILRHTPYLSVFSPNAGKYGPEKLRIWTFFTQWYIYYELNHLKNFFSF